MDKIKDKIERWKGKAEIFLKNNTKAFITDIADNYYFCDINSIDEDYLFVKNFAGKRKGEEDKILWFDIIKFEEYQDKE